MYLWGLFRHPVAAMLARDRRVALVGDAAHPTLPFLAQGANLALEDAWALADCLRWPAGPVAYQPRRRARAARSWPPPVPTPATTTCARCQRLRRAHALRLGRKSRAGAAAEPVRLDLRHDETRGAEGPAGPSRRASSAVMMPPKSAAFRDAPPTSAPSTFGDRENLGGVGRLDRPAIEHANVAGPSPKRSAKPVAQTRRALPRSVPSSALARCRWPRRVRRRSTRLSSGAIGGGIEPASWPRITSSVRPASRSSSVSPTQMIGRSPGLERGMAPWRATSASLSP